MNTIRKHPFLVGRQFVSPDRTSMRSESYHGVVPKKTCRSGENCGLMSPIPRFWAGERCHFDVTLPPLSLIVKLFNTYTCRLPSPSQMRRWRPAPSASRGLLIPRPTALSPVTKLWASIPSPSASTTVLVSFSQASLSPTKGFRFPVSHVCCSAFAFSPLAV